MGTVHALPVAPRLDSVCPAWCEDHREGSLPIVGRGEFPYVEHRGPVPGFVVPGVVALLELDVSTDIDGRTFSDGACLVLSNGDGQVRIPVGSLEALAGALCDATAVLRR